MNITADQLQFITDASNSVIAFVNGKYSINKIIPSYYIEYNDTKKKEVGLIIKTTYFQTDRNAVIIFNIDGSINSITIS